MTMKNEKLKIQLDEKEKAINVLQLSVAQERRASEVAEVDTARMVSKGKGIHTKVTILIINQIH